MFIVSLSLVSEVLSSNGFCCPVIVKGGEDWVTFTALGFCQLQEYCPKVLAKEVVHCGILHGYHEATDYILPSSS